MSRSKIHVAIKKAENSCKAHGANLTNNESRFCLPYYNRTKLDRPMNWLTIAEMNLVKYCRRCRYIVFLIFYKMNI